MQFKNTVNVSEEPDPSVIREKGKWQEPVFSCEMLVRAYGVTYNKALANDQLDAQFFYFIKRLLQSSTCFEQLRALNQEFKFY